jgi:hypothetical protein
VNPLHGVESISLASFLSSSVVLLGLGVRIHYMELKDIGIPDTVGVYSKNPLHGVERVR